MTTFIARQGKPDAHCRAQQRGGVPEEDGIAIREDGLARQTSSPTFKIVGAKYACIWGLNRTAYYYYYSPGAWSTFTAVRCHAMQGYTTRLTCWNREK